MITLTEKQSILTGKRSGEHILISLVEINTEHKQVKLAISVPEGMPIYKLSLVASPDNDALIDTANIQEIQEQTKILPIIIKMEEVC